MRNTSGVYFLLVSLIACYGCTAESEKVQNKPNFYYSGLIDDRFIRDLQTLPNEPISLYIASNGGKSSKGLEASKIILQKNINLVIDGDFGICASGCAEFILPSVSSIEFKNQPLVGYHNNPQIVSYILNESAADTAKHCNVIQSHVKSMEDLLKTSELNASFWQETYKRLELKSKKITQVNNQCPILDSKFKNELWFPTSRQLKKVLGLKFKGTLCSDNEKCYKMKIDKYWPAGTRMAIGNDTYISQGT